MEAAKSNEMSFEAFFKQYETKFKALADQKRLQIVYEICQRKQACVCDLSALLDMPQSKLSYHLKILLQANLIERHKQGTWSYYQINPKEMNHLLSEELCCVFRPGENEVTTKIVNGCCNK